MVMMLIGLCALAVAGLLVAESRDSEQGIRVIKPLASLCFLAVALVNSPWETGWEAAIFVGLILSAAGDVLLIPRGAGKAFQAGAASFLLGHVAYAAGFAMRGLHQNAALVGALVAAVVAVVILRWLASKVPSDLRPLVFAYVGVISVMLVLAFSTHCHEAGLPIFFGAAMFYVSDLSVARDRFIAPAFSNRLWGLPLYYGGQILLAMSL
jgi:uncharacterized membrane protein YhhN